MPRQVGLLSPSLRARSDSPNRSSGRPARKSRMRTTRSVGGDARPADSGSGTRAGYPLVHICTAAVDILTPARTRSSFEGVYSQPLIDAIAEAEKLVSEAPHIESEADLLEGLQYLAGCIAACTHVAFDYERDHPFLHSGTGPFTKMGLDNPDTLYFGTRVLPEHDYVVTGKRGT